MIASGVWLQVPLVSFIDHGQGPSSPLVAVAGMLIQCGHTVMETPDGNGIVVLAEGPAAGA